jgi:DNA-binding SARP family transcriptional activator
MTVRLYTLGRLSLERHGEEVTGAAAQPKRLAFMALLAAAGDAGLTRERLAGLLWAELPNSRARQSLAESLFVLRGALGRPTILTVGSYVRLNPREVWTDLGAFRKGIEAGALEDALGVYGGPFLDAFYVKGGPEFEEQVERERDRLGREFGRTLESLAEKATSAGDPVRAAEWWRRLAVHEPFSTRVAVRYVAALLRAGEPVLAKRFAAEFTGRLRKELGIEPEASILDQAKARIADRQTPPGGTGGPMLPPNPDLEGLDPDLEVLELIGVGSVARVYRAREHTLRREVAVKVLSPGLAGDPVTRARFEREALAAARIQHPNVAPVYRTGRLTSGVPYLVMPSFTGGTLASRLKKTGPLPLDEARRYVGQIAAGLAAAHRLGIVHRDVRPANILYDRGSHRVVLIDFGIAAVLNPEPGEPRLTLPGQRLGDRSYASPEQLRAEPVTGRADVYSLGVVAFEMLTGRLPFDGRTPLQMMAAHAVEEPRRPAELRPEVDAELDDLVRRCLAKRPEGRPLAGDVAEEMMG